MRKHRITRLGVILSFVFGMFILPSNQLQVQAKEVIATVQGTILSGTTSEILHLSTKEGKMEIKLDSDTDTSACKLLLVDKKISVSVAHGSDGYLHAVRITGEAQYDGLKLDASTTATVTGTIGEKTKDDILYFKTPQGEMQIKLDISTTMKGCSFLVMGKQYSIVCARGADAYMHAISITDTAAASIPGNTAGSSPSHAATGSVSGTVSDKTKEDILYLATKEGIMEFKIDSDADTGRGMVHVPGNKLTVSFYHGSDAYLHAVGIAGEKDNSSNAVLDASTSTVTGTVENKSTENILYLNTSAGRMELKLDKINTADSIKVLVSGKKVTVTCARGSDAYMHALTIKGA